MEITVEEMRRLSPEDYILIDMRNEQTRDYGVIPGALPVSQEELESNPPETDEWLDNEAVCRRLGISKRTLQSYRDTGKIPFSIIGHKCYYKESDIAELLNANNE